MSGARKRTGKLMRYQWGILISVFCMYFFCPTFSAINSSFAVMAEHFNISPAEITYLTALGNATSCISGLCVGLIAGKRIGYRALSLLACVLVIVFGGLPVLWGAIPWPAMLCSRALFGLGLGMMAPLAQAIIVILFEDETKRAAVIGAATICFGVGGSVASMACGALATISWQSSFAFYLFALIPLIFVLLFLHDSDFAVRLNSGEAEGDSASGRKKLPACAWVFIILFAAVNLLSTTFFNYISVAMAESNADTLMVGSVMTVFTVAVSLIALASAPLWKALHLWNYPLAVLLVVVGYASAIAGILSGSLVSFFAASVFLGMGLSVAAMSMPMILSSVLMPTMLTMAIGFQEVARNVGGVLSSPWLSVTSALFDDTALTQFNYVGFGGTCLGGGCCGRVAIQGNRR